ncbi:MAG: ABC transporter ATP-binding protein [Blastocatellia bacterium]|nr:ABC transporter ATP-binding protein [Blastocatellia bacterium]
MAAALSVDIEKRFPGGASVRAAFETPGEGPSITVIFGASGAGKTTILRAVAGLERPDRGTIRSGSETWLDVAAGVSVPPQQRSVGFVFQDYALFPHLSVAGNVGFGLGGRPSSARNSRVRTLLGQFDLVELAERAPRTLSGGEQQRVALARALAREPRLLLLDEPLAALDAPRREALRRELRRLLTGAAVDTLLVTHDRTEALALGDRIVVVDGGVVRQVGDVADVFSRPADLDVARIVGVETVVEGTVEGIEDGLATVSVGSAHVLAVVRAPVGRRVAVCIRSEDVTLERGDSGQSSARNRLSSRIVDVQRDGPLVRLTLDCGFMLSSVVTPHSREALGLELGAEVTAVLKAPAIHLVPRD